MPEARALVVDTRQLAKVVRDSVTDSDLTIRDTQIDLITIAILSETYLQVGNEADSEMKDV